MPLRLEFTDKYDVWSRLLKADTERLFVPTAERLRLYDMIELHLVVGGVLISVLAQVVGLRGKSKHFAAGLWLKVTADELDKVRRFLGLSASERPQQGRRARRLPCELALEFLEPAHAQPGTVRNLSELGLLLETLAPLRAGERVKLKVQLESAGWLALEAEVTRDALDGGLAGLNFVHLDAYANEALRTQLDQLSARPWPGKPTVLVAGDEPGILDFLNRALSKYGYEVHQARTGEQALAMVRELKPKLLVCDILMPGIDGVDVCKAMRADIELAELPVVFVSALPADRLHQVSEEAGATDYLTKPVALNDLLNVVGEYLR